MLIHRFFSFFSSLRLTVVCLAMAMILVFAGTLAQVKLGLWTAQEKYFHSLFVFWDVPGTQLQIPVWPGGYLLGGILLLNLIAAHFKRFQFTRKKLGIFIIHAGLILLLLGQFFTEVFQIESSMRLEEGQISNFTEDNRRNELAIVDVTDPAVNKVVSIPESVLRQQTEVRHPELPFTVRLKKYLPNSWPGRAAEGSGRETIRAGQGIGARLPMSEEPETNAMNDENKPTALVEIAGPEGSLGEWTVSTWFTKYPWIGELRNQMSGSLGRLLFEPQTFTYGSRTYEIALRPVRYYKPYSIELLDFSHDRYKGTDIPKNFSSHIQLRHAGTGENREVLIYMNNPLRYEGETYYQGSFERGDRTSILHVVRNPAWLTPYLSCTLVAAGLVVQFLSHLIGFAKRAPHRSAGKGVEKEQPKSQTPRKTSPRGEPAAAATSARREEEPVLSTAKRRTP